MKSFYYRKSRVAPIAAVAAVLLGISFFTFLLTYLAPGDPVRSFLCKQILPILGFPGA